MFEDELAVLREVRVDHPAFGGREQQSVDELLALDAAQVRADELQLGAGDPQPEHARVRGVQQVETDDFTALPRQPRSGLAVHQHHVAVASHRGVRRAFLAEGRYPAVFDQDVVDDEREVAVGGRPVVRVAGLDDDRRVEARLLRVVLAHVGVVPEGARVGEAQPVDERISRIHRGLHATVMPGVRHTVEEVVVPQAVPMDGRLELEMIGEADGNLRPLLDPHERTGDGAVVGEHADVGLADALAHGRGPQLERAAVLDEGGLLRRCLRKAFGVRRERLGRAGRLVLARFTSGIAGSGVVPHVRLPCVSSTSRPAAVAMLSLCPAAAPPPPAGVG